MKGTGRSLCCQRRPCHAGRGGPARGCRGCGALQGTPTPPPGGAGHRPPSLWRGGRGCEPHRNEPCRPRSRWPPRCAAGEEGAAGRVAPGEEEPRGSGLAPSQPSLCTAAPLPRSPRQHAVEDVSQDAAQQRGREAAGRTQPSPERGPRRRPRHTLQCRESKVRLGTHRQRAEKRLTSASQTLKRGL